MLNQTIWGSGCLNANPPLDMSCTVQVWTLVVQALLYVLSPSTFNGYVLSDNSNLNSRSIFDLSLQNSTLASMALSYTGNTSTLNVLTIYWTILIRSTLRRMTTGNWPSSQHRWAGRIHNPFIFRSYRMDLSIPILLSKVTSHSQSTSCRGRKRLYLIERA